MKRVDRILGSTPWSDPLFVSMLLRPRCHLELDQSTQIPIDLTELTDLPSMLESCEANLDRTRPWGNELCHTMESTVRDDRPVWQQQEQEQQQQQQQQVKLSDWHEFVQ
jgi:hypothetical protein